MRDDDLFGDGASHTDPDGGAGEDTYLPDEDAAPTPEGRVAQATGELKKLLAASAAATVLMGAAVAAVDAWRAAGFHNTAGYLVGAAVATLNLVLLAGGWFQVMRGQGTSARALVAFLGSFLALVLLAAWVVLAHRAWTLGFALGLTTPALAGILYGRTLR